MIAARPLAVSRELSGSRAVVTGGAGFIGSHLAAALADAGASVRVLDNLRTGASSNILPSKTPVELVRTSLRPDDLDAALTGAQILFHCAANAYVPPSVDRPQEDFDINVALTLRLLEWFRRNAPETPIILFSSAAVYGNPRRVPVDEDHPLDPISPYGVSKLAAERYGAVYAQLYAMPVCALRCFAVYGPRQRKQVIYDLMLRMQAGRGALRVLGDGTQVRDFCFVEDIARAAIWVAERAPLRGEVFNVGSGRGVTTRDLVGAIGGALGLAPAPTFTGAVRPGDPQAVVADWSRLGRLGWSPRISLHRGLTRTAEWLAASESRFETSPAGAR